MFSDYHGHSISNTVNIELGNGFSTKFKFCSLTKRLYGLYRFIGKYYIKSDYVVFFNYLGNSSFAIKVFDCQHMNHLRDIEGYFRFKDFMYPPIDMEVVEVSDDEFNFEGTILVLYTRPSVGNT